MKIKPLILIMLLATSTLFADENTMITKMQDMRDAMLDINDGFFYNNGVAILKGISKLKKANEIFSSMEDVKQYLNPKIKHMSGISYNNAKKINRNLDNMENFINTNRFNQAATAYTEVVNSCTACHAIVRGW